jgi:hypothetical protein
VVADPVGLLVSPVEPLAGDLLAERDRLENRRVAEATAADVVDLRDAARERTRLPASSIADAPTTIV